MILLMASQNSVMSHADKMTNLLIATFMTKILQKYQKYEQIAKSLAPCF